MNNKFIILWCSLFLQQGIAFSMGQSMDIELSARECDAKRFLDLMALKNGPVPYLHYWSREVDGLCCVVEKNCIEFACEALKLRAFLDQINTPNYCNKTPLIIRATS